MRVQMYSLTSEEASLIRLLNEDRSRVRLKIKGNKHGQKVNLAELQAPGFELYVQVLEEIDPSRIAVDDKHPEKSTYKITPEEAAIFEALNHKRSNTILIMSNYSTIGVAPADLKKKEFAMYLDLLGGFDPDKVVEVDVHSPFD